MDLGISNVEESVVGTGSLRRLMGEKQGISTTKKKKKNQNFPQIVKWVNLGFETIFSASGPRDLSLWPRSSKTSQIS